MGFKGKACAKGRSKNKVLSNADVIRTSSVSESRLTPHVEFNLGGENSTKSVALIQERKSQAPLNCLWGGRFTFQKELGLGIKQNVEAPIVGCDDIEHAQFWNQNKRMSGKSSGFGQSRLADNFGLGLG